MRKILKVALVLSVLPMLIFPGAALSSRKDAQPPKKEPAKPAVQVSKEDFERVLENARRLYEEGRYYDAAQHLAQARAMNPRSAEAYHLSGLVSLKLGLMLSAVESFTLALKLDPESRDARYNLASILTTSGNIKSAEKQVEILTIKHPRDVEVLMLLSRFKLAQDKMGEAKSAAQKALKEAPESGAALVNMANVHLARKENRDADRMAGKAAGLKTLNLEERLSLGKYYLRRGKKDKAEEQFKKAKDEDPESPISYLTLGELYIIEGKIAEAESLYREASALNPRVPGPRMRLIELLSGIGKMTQAIEELGDLLKYYPHNVEILSLKGRILLRKGDFKDAADLYGKLGEKLPNAPDIQFQLARSYLGMGKFKECEAAARSALRLDSKLYNVRMLLASALLLQGKAEDAENEARKVARAQPSNYLAYTFLGNSALARRDYRDAEMNFERVVKIVPENADAHLSLARVYVLGGKIAKAEKEFRLALKQSPGRVDILSNLVELLLNNNRAKEAVREIEAQIKRGKDPRLSFLLATAYDGMGDFDGVEKSLRESIELKPNYYPAHIELALFLKRQGRTGEGIRHLTELQSKGLDSPDVRITLGQLYMDDGKYHKAASIYEDHLKAHPDNIAAANNLVWVYTEHLKDLKKARAAAKRYLEKSDNPMVMDTLGWLHYRENDFNNAEKLLSQSAGQLARDPRVIYHLAVVKYRLGKNREARELLGTALGLKKEFPESEDARRLFERL